MSSVQNFFAAQAAYKAASDRRFDLRDQICRERGVSLSEAQKDPRYLTAEAEVDPLYDAYQALIPIMIRANLKFFGIADMEVEGVLTTSNGRTELGRKRALLSDICGQGVLNLADELGVSCRTPGFDFRFRITTVRDGAVVGHSNYTFDYEKAPDLRTALGWKIATDGGRVRLLAPFNLDEAVEKIKKVIERYGTSSDAFFGEYREMMKTIFVYESTSEAGDGYCGAMTIVWRVATREVTGQEHPGYPFSY